MGSAVARVLVVDDEESIRSVLRQVLTEAGHHVLLAQNGQEALDLLSRSDIDVMLLDIRMPGLSGLEVLSTMQAQSPETGVIMVTAIAEEAIAVEALQGAVDILSKPFDLDAVTMAVQSAFERRTLILQDRHDKRELEEERPGSRWEGVPRERAP